MPDGSQHEAYLNAYASNYITKDYWILSDVNNTNKLTFADGRIIYFEYFGRTVTIGGSQYKEYYASNIEDTHGNSISIVYKDPSTNPSYLYGTIDYIKEKQNPYRQVTFLYTLVGGKYRLWKIKRPDSKYIVFSYTNQSSYNRVLLTKVQPPVGNAWQYAYDTSGSLFELTKFTMPYNGTITYTYGTSGLTYGGGKFKNFRVVKKKVTGGTDIHSGTWNFSYFQGTDNEYTIITDPCNRTIKYRHYGYNSGLSNGNIWKLGLIRSKEIVGQETTTYAWTNSSLISYDDYVVSTWRDDAIYVPFMASQAIVRDGMTYTTSYSSYDNYGNPKVVTETGDKTRMRSLTYWYSTAKNIVKYKIKTETVRGSYPGTFTTTYTYDSNTGDVTSIDRYGVQTWFTYYLNGNLKTEKDANYKMTTYYWNNGRVSKVVTPEFTVNRSINVIGTVAWQDDGRGNKTYYSYDGNLRLTEINPPLGNNKTYTYAADGSSVKEARRGFYIYHYYDGLGRPSGSKNSIGALTDIRYMSCGPKDYFTSNTGDTIYYDYFGRKTSTVHQDNNYSSFSYSGSDAVATDETRNSKTYLYYDAFGNPDAKLLVSVKDAQSNISNYSYDILGSLTGVLQGSTARPFTYNGKDFLISDSTPEKGTTNYGRDNVGNMISKTDALGTIYYSYDGLNRLTKITHGSNFINFTYDGASNRTSMDNYSASIDYTYDSDNRLIKKVENIAGKTYTTQYTYDGNDNITDVYYPSGTQVHYAYNSNNQVTAVTGFGGSIINITYCTTGSCIGLPMSFTTSNGLTINLTYNNRNLTTQIKVGTSSLDIGYSYDGRGNVISITNNLDGTRSQSYEYDSLNRLITFNAGGLWGTGELTYDSLGNRKSKKIGNNPTSYYYSSNRLNYTTGNEPYDFSYNADGDMTSIDMQGFVYNLQYDRLHNLTSFLHNGVPLAKFTYDGDGLRVTKTSTDGDITVYHYDQSGNVISETDENGRLITDYVYLFDKLAVKILPMPHIVVSPGSYNFGDVYVNTAATTSITVQNSSTGTGELHLGTVTVDPSEFSIQADNCSGQTLLYGQSCSINIQFLPTAVESQNANLNIPSDDPDFHVKTVPLSGNGVLPILTILKGGDGFGDGAIVSTPMGIDCGADCSESYITGTVVALTAAHNVDSSFSGWSGGGCAGTGTCVVTMNADTEVTANFNVLPPLADFTSSAISGYTPAFTVNFIDASLRAHTWQWDFGDGSLSSTLQNPSHTYTSAGIYTVTLTVTNPSGQDKMVKTNYITVAPCPNKVRIVHADRSTTNYSTVQSAYDAAKNGETIQTQGIVFSENLNIYKDILVSIEGGYDCNYSTVVGKTSTIGNVSISAGTVHIGNFIISQ